MRKNGTIISIALLVVAFARSMALAGGAPMPTSSPVPATQPSGKWGCYVLADRPLIRAASKGVIWFGQVGPIWRYDVQTKTVRSLTPLDGIDLEGTYGLSVDLGPAGQVVLLAYHSYIWTQTTGWRTVPEVAKGRGHPSSYDFDRDGTLWGFSNPNAYRLKNGTWELAGDFKPAGHFSPCVRLGNGFFIWDDHARSDARSVDRYKYVSGDFKTHKPLGRQWDDWFIWRASIRTVNGRLYGVCTLSSNGTDVRAVVEITPDRLIEQIRGDVVGVDIAGKGFVKLTLKSRSPVREIWKVELTQGENPPDLEMRPGRNCDATTMRDTNGHVWVNQHRWDGKAWEEVIPDNAFTFQNPAWALSRSLTCQEGPGRPWGWLAADAKLMGYDPVKRTGWWPVTDQGAKCAWEMVELGAKGEIRNVQDVPVPSHLGRPEFQCPAGQWWGVGPGVVYRLAEGKRHEYSAGKRDRRDRRYSEVVLSPKGNVWMRHPDGAWRKWDSKTDTFVPGDVYDDHAFKLGPLTMSVVFSMSMGNDYDVCGPVYLKRNGRWEPWKAPFNDRKLSTGGFTRVHRGMVRGQRILVRTYDGVMEYDAEFDRWARLHHYHCLVGGFDDDGRRVLFGERIYGLIFVYDGDPFAAMTLPTEQERTRFESLLAKLDDDKWRVRDAATSEIRTLSRKWPGFFTRAYDRNSLSLEARVRLDLFRDEILKIQAKVPPSLFSSAAPSLPPMPVGSSHQTKATLQAAP